MDAAAVRPTSDHEDLAAAEVRTTKRSSEVWSDRPGLERLAGSCWFLLVLVLGLYALSPVNATQSDAALVPLTAHSLLYTHDLTLDEFPSTALLEHSLVITGDQELVEVAFDDADEFDRIRSEHGRHVYDYFPWTSAIVLTPAIVVNDMVAPLIGTDNSLELILEQRFSLQHRFTAAVLLTIATWVMRLMFLRLLTGPERRRRLIANGSALVFALGTSAWSTASRALWQHTPSLLALAVSLYLVTRLLESDDGRSHLSRGTVTAWLGLSLALASICRPTNMFVAVAVAVWIAVTRRRLLPYLVGGVVPVGFVFIAISSRLGPGAVPPYYAGSRFILHDHFLEALALNVVSPSRGLLFASPVVLLAVPGTVLLIRRRETKALAILLIAALVALWVSVSAFANWWAGHSYGPRFMTEAFPILFFLAVPAVDATIPGSDRPVVARRSVWVPIVALLAVWSVIFHGVGATSRIAGCWSSTPSNVDQNQDRLWDLGDSAFMRPIRIALVDHDPVRALRGPC